MLGLDRAVVFTVLARGWSSLAGIGTLALIARFLSPPEQGYYYTFYSLVALQIVFELGFSVVILQTASHEAALLTIADDGTVAGSLAAHARLASVLQKSIRWYSIAAVLMAIILLPVGIRFFAKQAITHPSAHPVSWLFPWILVVLATSLTFQIDPTFSFLEGCGYVSNVARTRLAQAILGTLMGWTALLLHHGLCAPGLIILGQALAGGCFVYAKRRLLLPLMRYGTGEHRIHWGTEIWPFQWRIAISWLCGYLTFQLFNPILFAYRGPVEAGQMGMSMNVCGTLMSMAIAWMNTKAAPFGRMIALRDFKLLDQVFFRALIQSTGAAVVACTGVWGTIVFLRAHHLAFALRLLPPIPLALLLLATITNIVVFAEALYLRAHKQEKFMINSIVGALWMAPAALLLGRFYGAYGIAIGYLCGGIVIGLGFGTYTFMKWRRIWHAA
jgi:O-antigen/teichoic acid export membrane protein